MTYQEQSQGQVKGALIEIRIECLSKSFGNHQVLDAINLTVDSAEMIAIVGPSGTGKSTLFRLIIGLEHPDQGRVLLADHESVDSPLVELAALGAARMERLERHWGVVFQDNALLSGWSVGANVALQLREVQHLDEATTGRRVREALREVVLDPEQILDLSVDELSGGMAKRVAIARALATDPILLLYDEPTTGLDPQVAEQIQVLIESTHYKKTLSGFRRTSLLITHDKEMLYRLQPRIVMLDQGHILFDGTYGDFQNSDSPMIRPYFDLMPRLHRRTAHPSASGQDMACNNSSIPDT